MEENQVSLVIPGKALHVHEPKEAKPCSQASCQERYTRQVNQVSTSIYKHKNIYKLGPNSEQLNFL